jgi:mercuric ion transport protein
MIGIERVLDKLGSGGVVIAALGCTTCFTALSALAAALGLSFSGQFEGRIINALLPLFAIFVLVVNCYSWYKIKFIGEVYYL